MSSPEPTAGIDSHAPLLLARQTSSSPHPPALTSLLVRVSGHRRTSMLVRETAARALEERRIDWGYSKPVVALDMVWNAALVAAVVVAMILTVDERPHVPVRVWVVVYALQCLVHVVLVWLEYRRRIRRRDSDPEIGEASAGGYGEDHDGDDDGVRFISFMKRFESINSVLSFVWWVVGFYWVVSGGDALRQHAPGLYWLSVVFLAFDVLFAMFCVALACLIGIALCCCLPCIIAILYTVVGPEGATEVDLSLLPKYRFQSMNNSETPNVEAGKLVPIETSSVYLANERILLPEDAECCICLNSYEDGADLHVLPCNHHFHSTCIAKWLKMNAVCPLCKYDILKGNDES